MGGTCRYVGGGVLGCTSPGPGGQYVVIEGDDGRLYLARWRGRAVSPGDRIRVAEGDIRLYVPREGLGPGARAEGMLLLRALEGSGGHG